LLCYYRIHDRFQQTGENVRKGEEIGIFEFGGSSIIIAFEKRRIVFDQDLVDCSKQQVQVAVEVGMSLGHATAAQQSGLIGYSDPHSLIRLARPKVFKH